MFYQFIGPIEHFSKYITSDWLKITPHNWLTVLSKRQKHLKLLISSMNLRKSQTT